MEQKQIFGVILGVIVCIVMLFAGLYLTGQIGMKKNVVPAAAEVQTTETTDTTMTAAETTAETTTVTTTTAQSAESLSAAEKERLHTIYGEKMTVVGDSIAYGFNAYGYISDEQNLAQGSVGIRNIHDFTFTDNDGQEVDVLDALEERQPAYIYMSMGMNDVNMCTEEEYINYYQEAISSIQQLCPNSNIIVAGITPVASDSDYTDNAEIRKFNDGLEQMIADLQQPNVVYFDAYSIVADPDTQDMNPDYSGGDSIHLASTVYQELLDAVYPLMDTMPIPDSIRELLQQSDFSAATEETTEETEEETNFDSGADSGNWTDSETYE